MKLVLLVAIFGLSYVASAESDCEKVCFQVALTYRIAKLSYIVNIDDVLEDDCYKYTRDFHVNYSCSKAIPMILQSDDIKRTLEQWSADSPSDNGALAKVREHCSNTCSST